MVLERPLCAILPLELDVRKLSFGVEQDHPWALVLDQRFRHVYESEEQRLANRLPAIDLLAEGREFGAVHERVMRSDGGL